MTRTDAEIADSLRRLATTLTAEDLEGPRWRGYAVSSTGAPIGIERRVGEDAPPVDVDECRRSADVGDASAVTPDWRRYRSRG